MTEMLSRIPLDYRQVTDAVAVARRADAPLLFQRFDLASRRLARSVIGLDLEPVAAGDFAASLRAGLTEDEAAGPLLVFAGNEALRGEIAAGPSGFPNHAVLRLKRFIEIDHTGETATLVGRAAASRFDPTQAAGTAEITAAIGAAAAEAAQDWTHDADFAGYCERFALIRDAAVAGEVAGAALSLGMERPTTASPFAIYSRFVTANPSPFGYVLRLGEHALVGSSPLAFLTASGRSLHLETDAGTKPVTGDAARDEAAAADLAINPKDAAEHAVVVEAEREALAPIARGGLIDTVIDRQVRRFSHVMHLYTALEAELAEGLDLADAILALAPAAAVSGHPKQAAGTLGIVVEGSPRGPYGGVLGLIDPTSGRADLAVVIRSLWISQGVARLRVGGKIVAQSEPESEYRECLAKARFLVEGVAAAERDGQSHQGGRP